MGNWAKDGTLHFWCSQCGPVSSEEESKIFFHYLRCKDETWIDDILVYKRVLSQTEIQKLAEVYK